MARQNLANITPSFIQLNPGINPLPSLSDNGLNTLVSNAYGNAKSQADLALTDALNFLNELQNAVGTIVTPTIDPNISLPALATTTRPNFNDSTFLSGQSQTIAGLSTSLNSLLSNLTDVIGQVPTSQSINFQFTNSFAPTAVSGYDPSILSSATEQAIWSRERDREIIQAQAKITLSAKSFAMRGFTKPPGAMSVEMNEAIQASMDASSAAARDGAIKQAELMIENNKYAADMTLRTYDMNIKSYNEYMNRALEAAKTLPQLLTQIFQVNATLYGSKVQAMDAVVGATASMYGTNVGAQEHIETAYLTAETGVYQANTQANAQMYDAELNANVATFKADVDALISEGNLRIEAAKANIQAMIQRVTLVVEAIKGGAQVASQLAASSLAAVNLSGAVHAQTTNSNQNSASYQSSEHVANQFSFSISDATADDVNNNVALTASTTL